jgi:hypothetical protein
VRLEKAVDLYGGDLLAGFTLLDCQRFEWWQLGIQGACHYEVVEALRQPAIYYEEQQDYGSVSRRTLALRQYEICRRELTGTLGGGAAGRDHAAP